MIFSRTNPAGATFVTNQFWCSLMFPQTWLARPMPQQLAGGTWAAVLHRSLCTRRPFSIILYFLDLFSAWNDFFEDKPCRSYLCHQPVLVLFDVSPNVVGTANATAAGWGNLGGGVTQIFMISVLFNPMVSSGMPANTAWRVAMIVPAVLFLICAATMKLLCWDTPTAKRFDESVACGVFLT